MKSLQKTISLLIILSMLFTLFAGCQSGSEDNDAEVKWNEYFYWLYSITYSYESYYSTIDWTEEMSYNDETVTLAEYMMLYADETVLSFRAVENYAEELGISLTDEELTEIEDSIMEGYDSKDEVIEALEAEFLTYDMVKYYNSMTELDTKIFESIYGEGAVQFSDEETDEYLAENEYIQGKHILLANTDDDGVELSEEEVALKLVTAEEVMALLDAYEGDDIESYFDELMETHNEDTGIESYPDGYLFAAGTMVTEFEDALDELGDYEYSEIVESDYGYHIILKLPVDIDQVPLNESYSLRYTAAYAIYYQSVAERMAEMEVIYEDKYNTLDLSEIFVETEDGVDYDSAYTYLSPSTLILTAGDGAVK